MLFWVSNKGFIFQKLLEQQAALLLLILCILHCNTLRSGLPVYPSMNASV